MAATMVPTLFRKTDVNGIHSRNPHGSPSGVHVETGVSLEAE